MIDVEQMSLEIFGEVNAETASRQLAEARLGNLESLRCCWPEWKGPAVSDGLAGRCEVGSTCAFEEARGERVFHYCAPCRILEVLNGGTRFRVAIDYPPDEIPWVVSQNGTVLLLDASEIWAPVKLLWAERRKYEAEGVV